MEIQTLKSSLNELLSSSSSEKLREYIQNYLNSRELTNFYELKYVAHMLLLTKDTNDHLSIVKTIKYSLPSGEGINMLISNLTNLTNSNNNNNSNTISLHKEVLKIFEESVISDDPHHIRFPGDKDSYLQVQTSTIGMTGIRAFTVAIWCKLSSSSMDTNNINNNNSNKSFLLFRCAGQKGGIDALLSDRRSVDTTMGGTGKGGTGKGGTSDGGERGGADPAGGQGGQWILTLRAFSDSGKLTNKAEIKTSIYFTNINIYHHFVMKHEDNNKISFYINGILEIESELPYQFSGSGQPFSGSGHMAGTQFKWTFGLGLKGGISNICFYSDALSQPIVQLLYGLGPHTKSIATGVTAIPQSSFDTGHSVLGSKISKGSSAHKLCRLPVLFNITAPHLITGANLPQYPLGRLNADHTEMTPWTPGAHFKAPTITGGCRLSLPCSWVSAWIDAGSCSVILHLISYYCKEINLDVSTQAAAANLTNNTSSTSTTTPPTSPPTAVVVQPSETIHCLKQTIDLLQQLLRTSADAKEQFLQIHGFHILSHHLAQLYRKDLHLTVDLVTACCALLPALGIDSRSGDGIAAALQGLLFDFRVWGECAPEVRMQHMFRLVEMTSDKGDELDRCIGVLRILDALRLYILRQDFSNATTTTNNNNTNNNTANNISEIEALHVACAEAGYSLLAISVDASLSLYNKTNNNKFIISDIESLFACLEETNSCLLAERILRIIYKYKECIPILLSDVLQRIRYAETTAVALLSRKGFSAEVYRETVSLLLWGLIREASVDSNELMGIRKSLVLPIAPTDDTLYSNNNNTYTNNTYTNNKRRTVRMKPLSTTELKRHNEGIENIKQIMKNAHKTWNIVSIISLIISKAISEGYWNNTIHFSNTSFINNRNNSTFMNNIIYTSPSSSSSSSSTTAAPTTTNAATSAPDLTSTSSASPPSASPSALSSVVVEERQHRLKIIHEILSVFHNNGPFGGRPGMYRHITILYIIYVYYIYLSILYIFNCIYS